MKNLTRTTGAFFLAGVASLFGGCGGSSVDSDSKTVLYYRPDAQSPSVADVSDTTMETPEVATDPNQAKYLEKYEKANAPRPVAASRPAAPQLPPPLASKEDIAAAKKRVADLRGSVTTAKNGAITGVRLETDDATVDDMKLIGRLADLETVYLLGATFSDEHLAELSGLKSLREITVQNADITRKTLEMFATFPELVSLDIRRDLKLENADLELIAQMPKLERLYAYYNSFTNTGMNKIAKSTTLKTVDVRGCSGVSDNGAKYLARLPLLEEVYFRFAITNAGAENLASAPNLRFIEFQDCADLNGAAVDSFKKTPSLTGLRIFRCQSFDDAALTSLGEMTGLSRLELRGLNVSNEGLLALKGLAALESVELSELGTVDEAGLNELLSSWSKPTKLNIFFLPATDATVKTIVSSLPNLTSLTLRATQITDASIDSLLQLQQLETLDIRENAALSADALLKLAQMKTLRKIYVKGTGLTASDPQVEAFKKANPKCAIAF